MENEELVNPLLPPNPADIEVIQAGDAPRPVGTLFGPGVTPEQAAALDQMAATGMGTTIDNALQEAILPGSSITQPIMVPTIGPDGQEMAANPAGLPAPAQLSEPAMVTRKVGEESTSTSQQSQSQATKDALKDYAAAGEKAKSAIQAEGDAQLAFDKKAAEKEKAESDAVFLVRNAEAAAVQKGIEDVKTMVSQRDALAAELVNQRAESFWGSKSASDKIAASISVGLGAYAQALLGSGQNVGMTLLQRNMDEFSAQQKQKYDAQVKRIESMNTSIDDKVSLLDRLKLRFDAEGLAAKEKVRGMFAESLQMAKMPGQQATIQKRLADTDMDIAKYKQETAAKYEAKVTKNVQKDVLEQIRAQAGQTKDGKPMTVEQAKEAKFFSQAKGAIRNIEQLDEKSIVTRGNLANAIRMAQANEAAYSSTALGVNYGQRLKEQDILNGNTPEERLKKQDPEAYNYLIQVQPFINSVLRSESGASIADPEFVRAYNQYFPQAGDGPKEVEQKRQRRTEAARAMFRATNLAAEPE